MRRLHLPRWIMYRSCTCWKQANEQKVDTELPFAEIAKSDIPESEFEDKQAVPAGEDPRPAHLLGPAKLHRHPASVPSSAL